MLPLFSTLLRQMKRWSNTFLSYVNTVLHGCSVTCTSLTNSSACVEHVYTAWRKWALYHNNCLYVQTLSSRRVHGCSYEFLRSGRSRCQKVRQDVAQCLLCLYLSAVFIFSVSHLSLPVLLLCISPQWRKQISCCRGKNLLKKKSNFIFVGKKKKVQFTLFPLQSLGLHF